MQTFFFLIQELNLDKIKEEIGDQDEKQKNTNTSPLFKANKPIKNIKVSIIPTYHRDFSK